MESKIIKGVILGVTRLENRLNPELSGIVEKVVEYASGCVSAMVNTGRLNKDGDQALRVWSESSTLTHHDGSPLDVAETDYVGRFFRSRLVPGVFLGSTKATYSPCPAVAGTVVTASETMTGAIHVDIVLEKLDEKLQTIWHDCAASQVVFQDVENQQHQAAKPSPPSDIPTPRY